MALYHLSVKPVSRGGGRSAVACAAYRCADVLHDERLGQTYDYERKRGVEAAFIVAPLEAAWAQERELLWNAAEAAEKRKDSRVGREYELALPCELDREGRRELVAAFAGELVERFGVAVDAAIHAPGREGDARNWHAHVLATTRRAEAGGLGEKAAIELSDTARGKLGWGKAADEIEGLRAVWAGQVNRALELAQVAERVDHRSYARQGRPELEATQHAGPAVSGLERKAERRRVQAQVRQGLGQAQEGPERVREAAAAAEGPEMTLRAPEQPQEAQERPQEAARAVPALVGASGPAQGHQVAQEGLERPRTAQERATALRAVKSPAPGQEGPVRPAAGMFGAGAEAVTRVGQRNAEIQERNRAVEAARKAAEVAQRVLESLERALEAGVRRVLGLARGLGAQAAAEREARVQEAIRQREALERAEAERRAELERQERARVGITQAEREAARARTPATWGRVDEAGQRAREATEAARSSQRQGPSLGM